MQRAGRTVEEHPPPGPFRRRQWRSPLRGPWLTSVFGVVLLVGIPVVFLTGLLSYAAYNPGLGGPNDMTPDKGILGFYLFAWPTRPVWLYRLTQGLHVTLGLVLVPVVLAKLCIAMTDAPVTVVVATRDRAPSLLQTVDRLATVSGGQPVIVVDNGSTDGSVDAVGHAFPDVQVVAAGRNLGAAARTLGVARASTPYVAFSDDDSWWGTGALDRAAAAMDATPTWV